MKRPCWCAVSVVTAGVTVAAALYYWSARSAPFRVDAAPLTPVTVSTPDPAQGTLAGSPQRPFRIIHIMSYDAAWKDWTMAQFDAFRDELADVAVDYRVVELDGRRNTSHDALKASLDEARDLIERWEPDLVYTTDDPVQEYLVRDFVNDSTPFVFSGVNRTAEHYGFAGSRNVTGVLEVEHILQTVELYAAMNPKAKTLAIVTDMGEGWAGVIQRFRDLEPQMPLKIVAVDILETYAEYQQKLRGYEGKVDGICSLGAFEFKDDKGNNVPIEEVGSWTYENVDIPVLSFWDGRARTGALCVVAISARAQGQAAGRIARGILVEGRKPTEFPIITTMVGRPIINLTVARRLGIMPSSTLLLSSEVTHELAWDEEAS